MKEFLNAKSLNHENIVKTYDLFTDPAKKEVVITMEHLKMKTLDYYLKKQYKFCGKFWVIPPFTSKKRKWSGRNRFQNTQGAYFHAF